ncbi:MAG: choice-of-anchor D domain-containing protein [Hahellaceae bacterium]|nr:choice-of-anchor D domain-containing protein [Hahellaceae bacterium]MCP5212629.1 choice-of-anchor D domain-containing protein [Hahellaceae bacterium]
MSMNSIALAAPVSASLNFTCPFPLIGDQTIIAKITADFPEEVVLGNNPVLGPINIDAITVVPDKARQGLAFVDATTITGTANSINTFHTVVGDIANNTDLTIVPTNVPAGESGPFDVPASGVAPSQTFDESHIGTVSLSVDDLILNLVNLKANGQKAPAPIGEFTADCALVAGQDNTLTSFEVVGDTVVVDPADIAVNVASVNFGSMQLGQSETKTVTITNAGDLDLGINAISITGTDSFAFTETNSCTTISAGSTCIIEVTYTASEEGTQNAVLVIESTDTDEPTVSVALSGSGQVELKPEIDVSVTSLDFGTIEAGTSASKTITISNTGGAALTIEGLEVAGTEFSKSSDNCSIVAAGASCSAQVTYTSVVGASTGTVTITSDDEDEATTTIPLSGIGEEVIIVDPGLVVDVDLSVSGSTYITANKGTMPLNGNIASKIDLFTGNLTGDLILDPTQGSFEIISGWSRYMATAQVEFEPVGITEGKLVNGKLTATSTAYIKLPKVTKTLFGLINWPIGGGENCRTAEPVTFTVTSPEGEPFDALLGGRVIGTYDLPKLENCGALTSILSLKLKGNGNTIDLNMTPILD